MKNAYVPVGLPQFEIAASELGRLDENVEALKRWELILQESEPQYRSISFSCMADFDQCSATYAERTFSGLACGVSYLLCVVETIIPGADWIEMTHSARTANNAKNRLKH